MDFTSTRLPANGDRFAAPRPRQNFQRLEFLLLTKAAVRASATF